MSTHELQTFLGTYEWAKSWEDLPWAHDEPTLFLAEICRRRPPGRALDIGCGAGTDSVFLAQQGWDVTSLDFVPKALEFTQQRAEQMGVTVTPVEADITQWSPPHEYDLVLDHGLLHNMDPLRHDTYRETVLQAVGENGEFVLLHWHPLFPGQEDGKMGPHRASREEIKAFFAPQLQERFFAIEHFESLPTMVGGGMAQAYYWFRPNLAWQRPRELVEQIKVTLGSNDVDLDALLAEAGGDVPDSEVDNELLAKIFGPGRFGLRHELPQAGDVPGLIAELAERAGMEAVELENLLHIFADSQRGNICMTDARCTVCEVKYCKRLRYR